MSASFLYPSLTDAQFRDVLALIRRAIVTHQAHQDAAAAVNAAEANLAQERAALLRARNAWEFASTGQHHPDDPFGREAGVRRERAEFNQRVDERVRAVLKDLAEQAPMRPSPFRPGVMKSTSPEGDPDA